MDIRLYKYDCGTLQKVGKGKTGLRPHIFVSIEDCENHIAFLQNQLKIKRNIEDTNQYIIVEYFGSYESRIVKIVENVK